LLTIRNYAIQEVLGKNWLGVEIPEVLKPGVNLDCPFSGTRRPSINTLYEFGIQFFGGLVEIIRKEP
jgi:hypothetical protein